MRMFIFCLLEELTVNHYVAIFRLILYKDTINIRHFINAMIYFIVIYNNLFLAQ